MASFAERHQEYQEAYDVKIMRRLPIFVKTNLRNFGRLSKHLSKPYSHTFLKLLATTLLHSSVELEGCVFAYLLHDEMIFVLRNDKTLETDAWFKNSVQGISSVVSSIVTSAFLKNLLSMEDPPELNGEAIFQTLVFAVPGVEEAFNHLVLKQHEAHRTAVNNAVYYEYSDLYGIKEAQELLDGSNMEERLLALEEKCGINFDKHYPSSFRKGVAAYKVPVINEESNITKYKWSLDFDVPVLHEDKNFLMNILNSGHDVFREETI